MRLTLLLSALLVLLSVLLVLSAGARGLPCGDIPASSSLLFRKP
jgi:hypothetical protein